MTGIFTDAALESQCPSFCLVLVSVVLLDICPTTTICVVLLHGKLNNKIIQDWVILFQHISFLMGDFYGVENMPNKIFLNTPTQDVV